MKRSWLPKEMITVSQRKAFRPMVDGLPVSIPISEALKNMGALAARPAAPDSRVSLGQHVVGKSTGTTPAGTPMAQTPSDKDSTAQQFMLKVTEIDCYGRNPRQFANERAEDIRESLKSGGFHGSFTVTRKPGGERYFLSAGGNTTLKLLQQLYEATGEERFLWVHCRYQPYASELQVLCQHLGENLNRGDMAFFDIARGMVDALELIEDARRAQGVVRSELSLREACVELTCLGLKADKSSVALWRFTVGMLAQLGPAACALTNQSVKTVIQPRINALVQLGAKFDLDEASFRELVLGPVLQRLGAPAGAVGTSGDEFAHKLCDEVEVALAAETNEAIESIRQMLKILHLNAAASLADLRQPSPNIVTTPARVGASEVEDECDSPDAQVTAPMPNFVQAPLALGPGLVRGQASAQSAGQQGRSLPTSHVALTQTPQSHRPQERLSSIGPLFERSMDETDPLVAIHAAVEQLALAVDLAETLRWYDEMPLGFYFDLPNPGARDQVRGLSLEESAHRRKVRSTVWWMLTTLAGQWLPGTVDFIDRDSLFYRSFSVVQDPSPLYGTGIETNPPTPEQINVLRIAPGRMRKVMRQVMEFECLVAEKLEHLPERWARIQKLAEPQED